MWFHFADCDLLQWSRIASIHYPQRARLSQERDGSDEAKWQFAANAMEIDSDKCSRLGSCNCTSNVKHIHAEKRQKSSFDVVLFVNLIFRSDTIGSFTSCQPICRNTWKTFSNLTCTKLACIRRYPTWACGSFRLYRASYQISWLFTMSLRLHKHAKYSRL